MPAIGNTPLIRLEKLTGPDSAEVLVKFEGANPTGSMKDRMALSMILGAERSGLLKPGDRVVDSTGGSTGSSLAMVCATRGYQSYFVSSDAFSAEKLRTMRAFGATLEILPSEGGKMTRQLSEAMIERARELSREPNTFWTNQFNNPDNRKGYHDMAREMLAQAGGPVDVFVQSVGTGGSFSGNAEILKQELPRIRCIALEPDKVRALSGGDTSGAHKIEGIGSGFIPSICRIDLADEIMQVADEDAFATARLLAKREGIFGGTSSGANVWAALQLARQLGPGKRIVTIICDSGLKYVNGELYS